MLELYKAEKWTTITPDNPNISTPGEVQPKIKHSTTKEVGGPTTRSKSKKLAANFENSHTPNLSSLFFVTDPKTRINELKEAEQSFKNSMINSGQI